MWSDFLASALFSCERQILTMLFTRTEENMKNETAAALRDQLKDSKTSLNKEEDTTNKNKLTTDKVLLGDSKIVNCTLIYLNRF